MFFGRKITNPNCKFAKHFQTKKAAHKMLVKLTHEHLKSQRSLLVFHVDVSRVKNHLPRVNFINVLGAHFSYKSLAPKFTKLCFVFEIFWRQNIGTKCASKIDEIDNWMSISPTCLPGVNFINILCAAFFAKISQKRKKD